MKEWLGESDCFTQNFHSYFCNGIHYSTVLDNFWVKNKKVWKKRQHSTNVRLSFFSLSFDSSKKTGGILVKIIQTLEITAENSSAFFFGRHEFCFFCASFSCRFLSKSDWQAAHRSASLDLQLLWCSGFSSLLSGCSILEFFSSRSMEADKVTQHNRASIAERASQHHSTAMCCFIHKISRERIRQHGAWHHWSLIMFPFLDCIRRAHHCQRASWRGALLALWSQVKISLACHRISCISPFISSFSAFSFPSWLSYRGRKNAHLAPILSRRIHLHPVGWSLNDFGSQGASLCALLSPISMSWKPCSWRAVRLGTMVLLPSPPFSTFFLIRPSFISLVTRLFQQDQAWTLCATSCDRVPVLQALSVGFSDMTPSVMHALSSSLCLLHVLRFVFSTLQGLILTIAFLPSFLCFLPWLLSVKCIFQRIFSLIDVFGLVSFVLILYALSSAFLLLCFFLGVNRCPCCLFCSLPCCSVSAPLLFFF